MLLHRFGGAKRPASDGPSARRKSRGQSLVEFSITLPVVLLMVLFGVDFGRVFLGWVTLNNAVREAANFAAINPTAWGVSGSIAAQNEYIRLVTAEADEINCTLPGTIPDPSFPSGTDIGSPAVVAVTCRFGLITPLIGNLLGSQVNVSASASFPIRSGAIAGVPTGGTTLPTGQPTAAPPTAAPTVSPIPTISPAPTVTPVPTCTVPNLKLTSTSTALATWTGRGFVGTNLIFQPAVSGNNNYTIKDQSLSSGASVPCTSAMTVYDKNQPGH